MAVARMRTSTSLTPGVGTSNSRTSMAPGPVITPTSIVLPSAGVVAPGAATVDWVIPCILARAANSPVRRAETGGRKNLLQLFYESTEDPSMPNPRFVLLDWDNTLHDSAGTNFAALERVLNDYGLHVSPEAYRRAYTVDYRRLYRELGLAEESDRRGEHPVAAARRRLRATPAARCGRGPRPAAA